jgi:hypothetical protein
MAREEILLQEEEKEGLAPLDLALTVSFGML